jgi:sodium/potassium-transporting ATPase subunit alpha
LPRGECGCSPSPWRPPAPTADAAPDAAEAEADLVFLGFVALRDPPRPEVPAAIETCRRAGVRLIMVTGDHPRTALALAREIGLADEAPVRIITGPELERMTAAELQLALDAPQTLFARLGPDQKTRVVEALRHKGEVVAVTGDGVNDAPALRAADIGIAMGRSGTDVAREAADLILLDDNFATIVAAVEEGRAVYDNLRKFLTYILTSNIPEIVPYVAFALFAIPLPLTVMKSWRWIWAPIFCPRSPSAPSVLTPRSCAGHRVRAMRGLWICPSPPAPICGWACWKPRQR